MPNIVAGDSNVVGKTIKFQLKNGTSGTIAKDVWPEGGDAFGFLGTGKAQTDGTLSGSGIKKTTGGSGAGSGKIILTDDDIGDRVVVVGTVAKLSQFAIWGIDNNVFI